MKQLNNCYPFVNLPLPYAYDALEPYIDTKTMELHHDKHLGTYINNLNHLLGQHPRLQKMSLEQLILNANCFPQTIRTELINNAGGVYNHRFYFDSLTNPDEKTPMDSLGEKIDADFGSFEAFKAAFEQAALSVFGSGYAWLVFGMNRKLQIITTANQNTPIGAGCCPILNIDVWEHAYYLKHYNVRKAYIEDWFQVVNWKKANARYLFCLK